MALNPGFIEIAPTGLNSSGAVPQEVEEPHGLWMALVATGMDPFEAIALAAPIPGLAAAHLWMLALRLVEIPTGAFWMGLGLDAYGFKDLDDVKHLVTIPYPFSMGAVQVTQGAWVAMMGANPSRFKGDPSLPVEMVSWYDAKAFFRRLNKVTAGARPKGKIFRLPSEAEWEYACLAETTNNLLLGNSVEDMFAQGWFAENSDDRTHPVGLKAPNPWGLFDMYGNVTEWCQDAWHYHFQGAPIDGSAWNPGGRGRRVVRTGDWTWEPYGAQPGGRFGRDPHFRCSTTGFRIVLSGL